MLQCLEPFAATLKETYSMSLWPEYQKSMISPLIPNSCTWNQLKHDFDWHYLANLFAMIASVWESITRGRHIGSTCYWAMVNITNGWSREHQVWRRCGTKGTKILDVQWFGRFGGQRGWRWWGSQLKSLNKTNTKLSNKTHHKITWPNKCMLTLKTGGIPMWVWGVLVNLEPCSKSHLIVLP